MLYQEDFQEHLGKFNKELVHSWCRLAMGNRSKGALTVSRNFVSCDCKSLWWSWKTKQSSPTWLGRPWLGPGSGGTEITAPQSPLWAGASNRKYGLTSAVMTAWKGFKHLQKLLGGCWNPWLGDAPDRSGQSPEQPDILCPCAEQGLGWRFPEALPNLYHPLVPWFERAEEIGPHCALDPSVWGCRTPSAARDRDNIAAIMDFLPESGARVHRNLASRSIMS